MKNEGKRSGEKNGSKKRRNGKGKKVEIKKQGKWMVNRKAMIISMEETRYKGKGKRSGLTKIQWGR